MTVTVSRDDAFHFVRGMHIVHGASPVGWRRAAWWRRQRFEVVDIERTPRDAAITLRELRWSWLRWRWTAR